MYFGGKSDYIEKYQARDSAITFMEPLPVALVISLVSAGILSRRRKDAPQPA